MPHHPSIKVIDISRVISRRAPVYPGNPAPVLSHVKSFKKDGSNLSKLDFGLHTASHLDAPLHYLRKGMSVDRVRLEQCLGWCRVVDATKVREEIDARLVLRMKPKPGEIILFKTKNSLHGEFGKFDRHFMHISEGAAKALTKANIKAVGIDGPSIRKFRLRPDTVHPLLLRAGVLIYEGLNLKKAKPGRYFFIGLPLKIEGAEGAPVRAVLMQ